MLELVRYQKLELVKQQLSNNGKNDDLFLQLDEAVGEYSASYGDTAYTLGFHDGMEVEQEHKEIVRMSRQEEKLSGFSLEDMANLIYVLDAYKEDANILSLSSPETNCLGFCL